MKTGVMIMVIAFVLGLTGCSDSTLKPIRTETIDFDLKTAKDMVMDMEKDIVALSTKTSITRQELEPIRTQLAKKFNVHAQKFIQMFFIQTDDDTQSNEMELNKNNFYPTIYHEDIQITEAKVDKSEYENPFFNLTYLRIKEEYAGKNPLLKGFYREYLYKQDEKGEWIFSGFGGTLNYLGEEYSANVLKPRQ